MLIKCLPFIYFFLLVIENRVFPLSPPIVAAYYENSAQYRSASLYGRPPFSPRMIDPDLLSDIYYAFAVFGYISKSVDPDNPRLTGDFSIQPTEWNDQSTLYLQIMDLKKRTKKQLRVFLSIGGWNFNDPNDLMGAKTYHLFSQMVSSAANRKRFIDSSIAYAHRYGFDGIDIDWEYPGDLNRGGTPEDFDNFITFFKECSTAFQAATPPLLLSYAAPPFVPFGVAKAFQEDPNRYFQWIARCAHYVDRIGIMAYDYHGPFNDPKLTGVNAPLNRDTNPKSTYYIAKTLQLYLDNGVPASKILLGMPTFGHSYAGVSDLTYESTGPGKPFESAGPPGSATRKDGLLAYFEIADQIAQQLLRFSPDLLTSTAYGYNLSSRQWVSFDTPETIKLKAKLAKERSLAGVLFWTVDMDEYYWEPRYPNIRSARQVFEVTPF